MHSSETVCERVCKCVCVSKYMFSVFSISFIILCPNKTFAIHPVPWYVLFWFDRICASVFCQYNFYNLGWPPRFPPVHSTQAAAACNLKLISYCASEGFSLGRFNWQQNPELSFTVFMFGNYFSHLSWMGFHFILCCGLIPNNVLLASTPHIVTSRT